MRLPGFNGRPVAWHGASPAGSATTPRHLPPFRILAILLAVALQATAANPPAPSIRQDLVAPGRFVFERHCVLCHGRRGNGKGELAHAILPRPRDFTRGRFKYRSTPSGTLPTDQDLARTIQGGLTGTAMPAFTQLTDREVRAVVEYLKTLSPRWTNATFHAASLEIPAAPDWLDGGPAFEAHAERGRQAFEANCAPCHGTRGGGDGPTAASLRDDGDEPCPPRDLRLPILRTGSSPESLHRTLLTGLDGTPMPSFESVTSSEERWDLVAFILSLRPR